MFVTMLMFVDENNHWHYNVWLFHVRGAVPLGGSICPYTRNIVDGGIQCSHLGVDAWNIPKPKYRTNMNTTIHDFPMIPSIAGVADL